MGSIKMDERYIMYKKGNNPSCLAGACTTNTNHHDEFPNTKQKP